MATAERPAQVATLKGNPTRDQRNFKQTLTARSLRPRARHGCSSDHQGYHMIFTIKYCISDYWNNQVTQQSTSRFHHFTIETVT